MMHFFCVGAPPRTYLAGTVIDEIMKIGGLKSESIAKYYIGDTASGQSTG